MTPSTQATVEGQKEQCDVLLAHSAAVSQPFYFPPREPASDPRFIKHVICEGARFHVLSYTTIGTHCSEPSCIINKRVLSEHGGKHLAAQDNPKE